MPRLGLILSLAFVCHLSDCQAVDWVRAGLNTNQPVWGIRGGLLWSLPPAGFRGGEPRGLIRLGYPILKSGGYDLINFIAIEPIVGGRRGFSELEESKLDAVPGKRIEVDEPASGKTNGLFPGVIRRESNATEILQIKLAVEAFNNGAHVRLLATQRSDRPDELQLQISTMEDSAPVDYCILTATMGNMARARLLWLKDRVLRSLELYASYKADGFAAHQEFPLSELHRESTGEVLVAITTNEKDPDQIYPFAGSDLWHYAGAPVTQFWRLPPEDVQNDVKAVVNGRYMYWRSHRPVPGGIAFENFELRERFHQGQRFIFGITRNTPKELGL